jgi:hypothetical protein
MGPLRTDFLFSRMGLMSGIASTFNLPGNFYSFNRSATPEEADTRAIFSDWSMVGEDLWSSIERFQADSKKQLELDLGA